jgi:WXXGXW repeat (2 copies)
MKLTESLRVLMLVAGLTVSAAAAEVVVRIAPPHAIVEHRSPSPGRDYVWIGGFHNWDGNRYVWVPGRWDRPPHAHGRWEAHRWVKRNGGWVMVEGHWR